MVNSAHTFLIFVVFSVIGFDFNHAAVRERRSLFFGNKEQTTTRTVIKSPLGFVSVSLAGGQKAPEDPCNPSQNSQQPSGRKPLIDIKIPTLFNRGKNQGSTIPPECATVASTDASPITHAPPPEPSTSAPVENPAPKPVPPSTPLPVPSTAVPSPSTSAHFSGSSTTANPDDELINSIFGEESAPTTAANNGAGLIDFRRPVS